MVSISPRFQPVLLLFFITGFALFTGWLHSDIVTFLFILSGWVISLCVHEFGHAYAALKGGDRTIAHTGYLSFDPFLYMDPITSIVLPIIFIILGGFGFPGGAVYINKHMLRSREWVSFTSAAGPLASLAILLVLLLPMWVGLDHLVGREEFWGAVSYLSYIQVTVLVLNLLPIPGLDGYGIIEPFLPYKTALSLAPSKSYAAFFFIVVMFSVPAVQSGFFNIVTKISAFVGLNLYDVSIGMNSFFFWKTIF